MNGCLSGLVAITAGCSVVESWASIIIGLIAGVLYWAFSKLLVKRKIDDAVDAIPVHVSACVNVLGLCVNACRVIDGLHSSFSFILLLVADKWHMGLFCCRKVRVCVVLLCVNVCSI